MTITRVPLRTGRGLNDREHHMTKARRVKAERYAVGLFMNLRAKPKLPVTVLLTRQGPTKRPLDDDNLQGALKAVRDEVARWIGVDDASPQVKWTYAQQRTKLWGVQIEVNQGDWYD